MIDPKLKKKLNAVVSKYVRLKYANKKGMVRCYTCNTIKYYKQIHCGHFVKRNHTCEHPEQGQDHCEVKFRH